MTSAQIKFLKLALWIGLMAALGACSKEEGFRAALASREKGTTGYTNSNGSNYTVGKDELRVRESNKELQNNPGAFTLAQSITKGRVLRYNQSPHADRFGDSKVKIILRLEDASKNAIEHRFEAPLTTNGKIKTFAATSSDQDSKLKLSGYFEDRTDQLKSEGAFVLTDGNGGEARILFRAYMAQLTLRPTKEQETKLQAEISELKKYQQAWANNFVVAPLGRAFYDYILIRENSTTTEQGPPAPISFSGEAIRTSEETTEAQTEQGQEIVNKVRLLGDAEEVDQRTFEFTLKPSGAAESEVILVDIDSDITPPDWTEQELLTPADRAEESKAPQEAIETQQAPTSQEELSDHEPVPAFTEEPPVQEKPQDTREVEGQKGFFTDANTSSIRAVTADLDENIKAAEVQAWVQALRNGTEAPRLRNGNRDRENYRIKFLNFISNAAPFRELNTKIFNSYNLPAAMSYLTINESQFFMDRNYPVEQNSTSTSYGAFQFIKGTAEQFGMRVDSNQSKGQKPSAQDERGYYAPSACGAGAYFSYLTNLFKDGDRTLGLLAYRIGEGAAAAAVECHESNENRAKCESSGLNAFTGSQYNRFIKDLSDRRYTFAEVSRRNFVGDTYVRYVRKWLAFYAVGKDLRANNFELPTTNASMPMNKVLPPSGIGSIKSSKCRSSLSTVRGF